MAVFTKLNQADIYNVQNIFGFKKITSFKGIKKGIENTNYTVATKNKKYVLTIFESRVNNKDLPYFMKLMDALSKKGIKTNVTLCFSVTQALLAAKCGATFISPFIGRLDDIGQSGVKLISDIRKVFDNYKNLKISAILMIK